MKPLIKYLSLILVALIIYSCQDAEVAALQCYTCYYVGEGANVSELPGDWKNWTSLYNETCEHAEPDPKFAVNCDPLKFNPTLRKSCSKMIFTYLKTTKNNERVQYRITLRGCMEMKKELADGECIDKSLRNLIKLSAIPSDFWPVMEWFPHTTYADVCSCTSDRCNATSKVEGDRHLDAVDGAKAVILEKSMWTAILFIGTILFNFKF